MNYAYFIVITLGNRSVKSSYLSFSQVEGFWSAQLLTMYMYVEWSGSESLDVERRLFEIFEYELFHWF